jgi:competence protein ComFB
MFAEIHNTTEDFVFAQVAQICDSIEKSGSGGICTCRQCRMDTACYVLNRIAPHYVISNRGVARVERETLERQQKEADISVLVYEGLKRVNHNQRPFIDHQSREPAGPEQNLPVYNIPTIVGRLFNGQNFEPMAEVKVELHRDGNLVAQKDGNWQNPYTLVPNTEGTFTFWPDPIPAEGTDIHKTFEYSIKVEAPNLETLQHFFKIAVVSELQSAGSFSMARTFKLQDLYMFPPDEDD